MYVKVPALNGIPQVGTARLIVGMSVTSIEAIAMIDGELQEGWVELTEEEYLELGGVIPQPTEPVIPEPTEQELVNAELLLSQAHIMENQAAIEETAALILLETVGGGL